MNDQVEGIKRLFRACEPYQALDFDDPRYVDCDDVRGPNLATRYERWLRWASPEEPEVKLFAGHRGVGKTSELLRLKNLLEEPSGGSDEVRPFHVIYFDVMRTLDPNDTDFPDLLVLTAGTVQEQLREAGIPGFSGVDAYLSRVWDDITGLLGKEVVLSEAGVRKGLLSLAMEFRSRPNARQMLRKAIEAQSTHLLGAVNDLLTKATVALREKGYEGLVLLVDGLDKLVLRPLRDGDVNTHERLFVQRGEQLASLAAHTVYTVPISLIYRQSCAQLEQVVGDSNSPVPMIRLHDANGVEVPGDSPGMRKLWEIIEKRCQYAKVDIEDVFDEPGTGHLLCRMTGGHPRHLMTLLRSAAVEVDRLPITRAAVEQAIQKYANSLLREIPDRFWPKLHAFGRPQRDIPKDEDHLEMLFLLHIFEYMNREPWYEVNPVIRTLPKFEQGD